jgi:hypothetical protein
MKKPNTKPTRRIHLPRNQANLAELSSFALLEPGVTEVDPDRADLDRMLSEYRINRTPSSLNIRIPPAAKRMIEKLAKRKTIKVSTLVRMWVIDSMRREAAQCPPPRF